MSQAIMWKCDVCGKAFAERDKVRNELTFRNNGNEPVSFAEICDKCLAAVEEKINELKSK